MKKSIILTIIVLFQSLAFYPDYAGITTLSHGNIVLLKEQAQKPGKRKKAKVKTKSDKEKNKVKHVRMLKRKIKDCGCK
jgi:hypothetical protein